MMGAIDDLLSSVKLADTLVKAASLLEQECFRHGDFYGSFDAGAGRKEEAAVFFEHYADYWGTHPFYGIRTRYFKYIRYCVAKDI